LKDCDQLREDIIACQQEIIKIEDTSLEHSGNRETPYTVDDMNAWLRDVNDCAKRARCMVFDPISQFEGVLNRTKTSVDELREDSDAMETDC